MIGCYVCERTSGKLRRVRGSFFCVCERLTQAVVLVVCKCTIHSLWGPTTPILALGWQADITLRRFSSTFHWLDVVVDSHLAVFYWPRALWKVVAEGECD